MKRHLLVALAAVLAVGFTASAVRAQCKYEHPKKAGKLQSNLVQAMVSCGNPGGNAPNAMTEGGVPTCQPPETFNQQAGTPANGWQWNELKAQGKVQFKAKALCTGVSTGTVLPPCSPADPLNLGPPPSADLEVKLDLKGIVKLGACEFATCTAGANAGAVCTDDSECPTSTCDNQACSSNDECLPNGGECIQGAATGTGFLSAVARATLDDRVLGDMTVVDFPTSFPFDMVNGKAKLKTSADALLNNAIGQPGLAPCASIEVVSIVILDANNNAFATMGTFLPIP
jgi:hypothetical protein